MDGMTNEHRKKNNIPLPLAGRKKCLVSGYVSRIFRVDFNELMWQCLNNWKVEVLKGLTLGVMGKFIREK